MANEPWFDEIDLDPAGSWLRMGTRNLGERPWLLIDDRRHRELGLKRQLLTDRHDEVFAASGDSYGPGAEALQLVVTALETEGVDDAFSTVASNNESARDRHPLDLAGRMVQEDLCLLRPGGLGDREWILAAASLCFPSRWRLAEKVERPLAAVHGPVVGYEDVLSRRVDRLLSRLGSSIVWRRNWFIHPDSALFQPDRPVGGDPIVAADRCFDELFLRSERQTLRRLDPSGWVLFTIRIQQCPLRAFVQNGDFGRHLARFSQEADRDLAAHKGLPPAQLVELERALAAFSSP